MPTKFYKIPCSGLIGVALTKKKSAHTQNKEKKTDGLTEGPVKNIIKIPLAKKILQYIMMFA